MTYSPFREAQEFTADFCGVPIASLSAQTRLERDLGVTGHDGFDFFDKFAERFNVDVSGLRLECHFDPEAPGCWTVLLLPVMVPYSVIRGLFWRDEEDRGLLPVTLSDLARAVEAGRFSSDDLRGSEKSGVSGKPD